MGSSRDCRFENEARDFQGGRSGSSTLAGQIERSSVSFTIFPLASTTQTLESSKDMLIPANVPWLSSVPRCLGLNKLGPRFTIPRGTAAALAAGAGGGPLRHLVYDRSWPAVTSRPASKRRRHGPFCYRT